MSTRQILWFSLAAATALSPVIAQEGDPCSLPGELVLSDAPGDSATGAGFDDILSLHMAEPQSLAGKLVFTYTMSDLSAFPPGIGWILRFSTDEPPSNGDEDWFVAMFSTSGGERFVHGTNGFTADAPAEPRQFRIAGDLDAASNFNADGTITLVLDKTAIPGLNPGQEAFNILPTVRLMAVPAEDGLPFTTNAGNETIVDDIPGSGFYAIVGDCGEGKSFLGIGALGWPTLILLTLAGLGGWRRRG